MEKTLEELKEENDRMFAQILEDLDSINTTLHKTEHILKEILANV